MKVQITAEDITVGKRTVPTMCPVALGMRRAFPELDIKIGPGYVVRVTEVVTEVVTKQFILPAAVTEFIRNFDRGNTVEPFEFEFNF